MPARRRGQEPARAARRAARGRRPAPAPMTVAEEVDHAWREVTDPDLIWCCPDCHPDHPANLERAVAADLAAYRGQR